MKSAPINEPADVAPSTSYLTAVRCLKLVQQTSCLDLSEDDYRFLTMNSLWIGTDRPRIRHVVESAVYGAVDYIGFPRIAVPAEFIAAAIAVFVAPMNYMVACSVMEGAEFSEHIINGVDRPVSGSELFAFVLRIAAGDHHLLDLRQRQLHDALKASGSLSE